MASAYRPYQGGKGLSNFKVSVWIGEEGLHVKL